MTNYAEEIDVKGIKEAVEKVFEELLSKSGAVLKDVFVRGDCDHDGNPVLRILIAFESETGKLDPSGMLHFRRYLFEPLAELGERRFPMIDFITKADKEELDADIAKDVKKAAKYMFERRFSKSGATLTNVSVEPPGDKGAILKLKVSFSAEGNELDSRGKEEFERDLRNFMEIAGDYRSPQVNFIQQSAGR